MKIYELLKLMNESYTCILGERGCGKKKHEEYLKWNR